MKVDQEGPVYKNDDLDGRAQAGGGSNSNIGTTLKMIPMEWGISKLSRHGP